MRQDRVVSKKKKQQIKQEKKLLNKWQTAKNKLNLSESNNLRWRIKSFPTYYWSAFL